MEDAISIYCKLAEWSRIVNKVGEMPDWKIEKLTDDQIYAASASGKLVISFIMPSNRKDFDPLYMGMLNLIRGIPNLNNSDKEMLSNHVRDTHMVLGCIARPEFNNSDERFNLLLSLAKILNGILFDMFTFFDSSHIIVSIDGTK